MILHAQKIEVCLFFFFFDPPPLVCQKGTISGFFLDPFPYLDCLI